MSEAIAAKRIRAGRTAYGFPCIFRMIARAELRLTGVNVGRFPLANLANPLFTSSWFKYRPFLNAFSMPRLLKV
jgi:hypothetical protein